MLPDLVGFHKCGIVRGRILKKINPKFIVMQLQLYTCHHPANSIIPVSLFKSSTKSNIPLTTSGPFRDIHFPDFFKRIRTRLTIVQVKKTISEVQNLFLDKVLLAYNVK